MSTSSNELFNLFGKFDYDEALEKVAHSAAVLAMSMQAAGGEVPDDQELYPMLAQSLGMPNGEAYAIVRKAMMKQGWAMVGLGVEGPTFRLTKLGNEKAEEIKKGIAARLTRERAARNAVEGKDVSGSDD